MSGRILAIDTAAAGSLALIEDGRVVAERQLTDVGGFSPVIFGELATFLEGHAWPLNTIDAFAAGSGPGSFTGVRVALSAVKGLAEALHRPAYAISNLAAAARLATGATRAPWLDARRGEVYGGVFDASGVALLPEMVGPRETWVAGLPEGTVPFAADGVALAAAIGEIAWERWSHGDRPDPVTIDANYVRRADAELAWKDR